MSPTPAVGIDLGTTYSCVSVYKNGRAEIVPTKDGNSLTPSVVYFNPETGEVSVGNIAKELIPRCPGNGLLDAKRIIGRRYDDEFISRYSKSQQRPFSLVRELDKAAFEVEVSGTKLSIMPDQVSTEVLKYLKDIASDYIGQTVTEAVISVPAYFSNAQRQATESAAHRARLTVLKLIPEPTATAIHYLSGKKKNKCNILVFDFGGGTLDVSVININNKTFEVKAVYGDTLLGGSNFDEILFDYFLNDFPSKDGKNSENKRIKHKLNNLCINLKEKLSENEECVLQMDRHDGRDSEYSLSLTRKKFEILSKDIFQRCLEAVKICLKDANLSKSDIDEVVLVGGSTRIPKIREMLQIFFDRKPLKLDLNPHEAVAAGACIQAAVLKQKSKELEKYSVTEVTPLLLGIKMKNDYMKVFIEKNSLIPMTASHNLVAAASNHTTVIFEIYEGERKNTIYNNKLCEFYITNLPPNRAEDIKVKVTFVLNENGLLRVQASEKSTRKNNTLCVTLGHCGLSEKSIEGTLEEVERNRKEDDTFVKFIDARCNYNRRCNRTLHGINKILSKDDREFVQKSCKDFLMFSKGLHFTKFDELERRFRNLMTSIDGILKHNNLLELQYLNIGSSDDESFNDSHLKQAEAGKDGLKNQKSKKGPEKNLKKTKKK